MRSRLRLALVGAAASAALAALAQPAVPPVRGESPARDEVQEAVDALRSDPSLAPERTVQMLRFAEPEQTPGEPWWRGLANALARFTRGLFGWLAESGRVVVWVLGAGFAALLVAYLLRVLHTRGLPRAVARVDAPSHVRDLDIRPESLPEDIGAAALALWQRGEQRVALALLYRGMLSRLVHVHGVPIRASSTEGECLALARARLAATSAAYAARLIGVWSAAVYGAARAAPGVVEALCGEFGASLDGRREASA